MRIRRPLYLASYLTMVLRSVNINITIITTKTFLPTFSTKLFPTICPPFFQCSSPMILRNSNIKSQTPGILSSHSRSTGWSMSVPKDSKSSWITPPFKDMFTSHVVSIDYVIICQMYICDIYGGGQCWREEGGLVCPSLRSTQASTTWSQSPSLSSSSSSPRSIQAYYLGSYYYIIY